MWNLYTILRIRIAESLTFSVEILLFEYSEISFEPSEGTAAVLPFLLLAFLHLAFLNY